MSPDKSDFEPLSFPLRELEQLAEDIASLTKVCAEAEGTGQALLTA